MFRDGFIIHTKYNNAGFFPPHISDFVHMKTHWKSEIRMPVNYSSQCYRQKPVIADSRYTAGICVNLQIFSVLMIVG
jgi:hypothetical protein